MKCQKLFCKIKNLSTAFQHKYPQSPANNPRSNTKIILNNLLTQNMQQPKKEQGVVKFTKADMRKVEEARR